MQVLAFFTMKDVKFTQGLEHFALCLHDHLCRANPGLNIIYSPLSIQTSAAMLRMGTSEGSATAKEMDEGLRFDGRDVQEVAESFGVLLKSYEQCQDLKMVNGLYVMKGLQVDEQFGHILEQKFCSKPMEIDFSSEQAASIINHWVESQTNNLIKDIIGSKVLAKDSRLCLVSAIHFQGKWAIRFNAKDTREEEFFGSGKPTRVRMMHVCENFFFAVLPKFDATALRMNYSACNMAMIVILPDKKSSLTSLEKQLTDISLEALSSVMNLEKVDVKIPSFTAEFQQELSQAFILMGMNRMFSGQAELGRILKSQESLFVSKIVHKSFIEVNEVGTEAAAATAVAATFRSMPAPQCPPKAFRANRPFFYAIIDNTHGLLFAGHFVTARAENSKHVTHVPKETDARMKE